MTSAPIYTSAPDKWSKPRPYTDATIRRLKHGPVQPMEEPSIFDRWFR
ncbi:MAG: hypothetical protein AAGE86_11015 [Pseudomonadota bacterium]